MGNVRSSVSRMDGKAGRLCYHLVGPALKGVGHAVLRDLAESSMRQSNINLRKRGR